MVFILKNVKNSLQPFSGTSMTSMFLRLLTQLAGEHFNVYLLVRSDF